MCAWRRIVCVCGGVCICGGWCVVWRRECTDDMSGWRRRVCVKKNGICVEKKGVCKKEGVCVCGEGWCGKFTHFSNRN